MIRINLNTFTFVKYDQCKKTPLAITITSRWRAPACAVAGASDQRVSPACSLACPGTAPRWWQAPRVQDNRARGRLRRQLQQLQQLAERRRIVRVRVRCARVWVRCVRCRKARSSCPSPLWYRLGLPWVYTKNNASACVSGTGAGASTCSSSGASSR